MATQLQLRRGTTSQVAAFTGAHGEVVVDTEKKTLFDNDRSTAGGLEIARADFSNISASATLTLATLNATTLNTTNLDLTNLEVTNIKAKDGTSAGSIADSTGVVTIASAVLTTADINAGTFDGVVGGTTPAAGTFTTVSVDNITIDGTEIDLSSGDLTLDVAGEINLDADDGKIRFKDGGTEHLRFVMDNAGVVQLYSAVQDSDIKIQGNDGGSVVDALTFDMSEGGNAVFGKNVSINAAGASTPAPLQAFQVILHSGGGRRGTIYYNANNRIAFAALNASNTWESMEIEASDINFNTGGSSQTTALTLNSSQNAGLGVTPESWNSNFRALQIGPWGSLATTTSGNGESFRVNANFYNDGSAEKYLGTGYALMFKEGVTAGSFVFSSSQASGSADGSIASWYHSEIHNHSWAATLETTTSDGSDNYGVGLDAGGGTGSAARGAGLWVYGNEHSSNPGNLVAQMGASGDFIVHTSASGTERFRVLSDGNVGIGTSNPAYKLDVGHVTSGSIQARFKSHGDTGYTQGAIVLESSDSTSSPADRGQGVYMFNHGQDRTWYMGTTYADASTFQIGVADGTTLQAVAAASSTRMVAVDTDKLAVSGMVRFSASGADATRWSVYWNGSTGDLIVVSSDKRLKKDFDYDLSGIETIKKLKPVRFTWKESERRQLGFLAQDSILADEHLAWNDTETDQWGLDGWEGYAAMLAKAIQEQQTQIEALQAEVAALKGG